MVAQPVEVEAKFICPPNLTIEALEQILRESGLEVSWQPPVKQVDVYLDTPDYILCKNNASLRIRCIMGWYVGTFKTLKKNKDESLFERKELSWDLSEGDVKKWKQGKLSTFPEEVKLHINTKDLHQVLTVKTNRQVALLNGPKGMRIELGLDETKFFGKRGIAEHRELELELKSGAAEDLQQIAEKLRETLKLQPSAKSKYALGIELVG